MDEELQEGRVHSADPSNLSEEEVVPESLIAGGSDSRNRPEKVQTCHFHQKLYHLNTRNACLLLFSPSKLVYP